MVKKRNLQFQLKQILEQSLELRVFEKVNEVKNEI
jgi:hypothetical protein